MDYRDKKKAAILEAFEKVERQFSWSEDKQVWMSATAVSELFSDFDQQKQRYPIVHPYDIQILSRMMVGFLWLMVI